MANFLPDTRLQGIMELVFVILDWVVFLQARLVEGDTEISEEIPE